MTQIKEREKTKQKKQINQNTDPHTSQGQKIIKDSPAELKDANLELRSCVKVKVNVLGSCPS